MSYPTDGLLAFWTFRDIVENKILNFEGDQAYDFHLAGGSITTVDTHFDAGLYVGEQDVVRFGDRSPQRVVMDLPDLELFEIEPTHIPLLRPFA